MVGGFSSRGGRGATWTFAGRVACPGIFNVWLPSLTPTGVRGGSRTETMTYHANSRLVTSVEGAVVSTYTFDANGNQTAVNAGGSRTTYAYDYENRMRTAIDPGGARSTMAYWADGMRRFLEVGGTRMTFVWDGSDYLQSRTPSEVTTFSTVDAQILDSETGGSESLLVPDPLGSVVKVLDASGNQVYDAEYWPYGEIRSSVGVNDTSWGYGGTWGYHFDMSRRLYIRARVLDPVTGRWYTVDPLWPTELAYPYAANSPNLLVDPFGKAPCASPCAKYPGGPCAYAKSIGDDKGDGGGVVCCEGKKYACEWIGPWQPGLKKCVVQHENSHLPEVDCPPTGYDRPPFSIGGDAGVAECLANYRELQCISKSRPKDCGKLKGAARTKCEREYQDRICQLCDVMKNKYKCISTPAICKSCP